MLKLLDKQKEPLALLSDIKDLVITRKVKEGETKLSFSLYLGDLNVPNITEECYVDLQTGERFIVKSIANQKQVVRYECHLALEELSSKIWADGFDNGGSATVVDTVMLAIAGTGWTVETPGITTTKRSLKLDGMSTLDIIYKALSKWDVEVRFYPVLKKIVLQNKIGSDKGVYFTDELNMTTLNLDSNSYDFTTRLYVRGKDGLNFADINGGKDYVEDFKYSNKIVARLWTDTRYTDKAQMLLDAKNKIAELAKPKMSYDVELVDLSRLNDKYSFLSYEIGDTITLLSKQKQIKDVQRIVELREYPLEPERNSATIANTQLTFEELQKKNEEMADKVDGAFNEDGTINGNMVDGLPSGDLTIPDDSIEAKHIKADAIETKHLKANSITAEKIQAGQIEATHIKAGTITANSAILDDACITTAKIADASITNAKIADASIDSAKIDVGQINSAHIQDAAIGTAQIADAAITVAKIQDLFVDDLVANQGKFNSAHIGELEAGNIKAGAITTEKLAAGSVEADKIAAGAISTDKLAANSITSDKIAAGTIVADDIAANAITTEKINAGAVTAGKVAANAITAGNIQAGAITAGKLAANSVEAGNIKAGAITADKIGANAITTDKLAANSVTADKIKAGAVEADKISADAVNAIAVSAGSIVANDITTGAIKISNANILDGTINGAKITSASITNAQIKDATIESAKIKDLNASKITTGTLDTTKVSINSTSGALTIADNTLTIKDNQTTPKTRVQIGKDTRDKYGILVMNAAGEAIFDSDYGVLSDKGLNDGVVSTDKIVDEAVAPSKIQIKELWAEEAYINEFNGQTINADNITTGTISGERIDIKGLINFEALDEDLSKLFVPGSGNGTVINGGFIGADTIKAGSIDLYSGLNVRKPDGTSTFAIAENGEVEVNGLLKSGNFDESKNTGYRISTDGTAILNQARVSGEFVMPNAGITNYGATIGNENLLKNSNFVNNIVFSSGTSNCLGSVVSDREGVTSNYEGRLILIDTKDNIAGDTYIYTDLTVPVEAGEKYNISFDCWGAGGFSGSSSYLRLSNGNHIRLNHPTISDKVRRRHSQVVTIPEGVTSIQFRFGYVSSSYCWMCFDGIKVERGDKETPWCPNKDEQFNYTRIWAGSSYEARDTAPFRVSQDGSLYALDGTFTGRVYGNYDNDKIHIHDNQIVIDSTSTFLDYNGQEQSIAPMTDTSDNPYIKLSAGQSILNTDVVFGSSNDKRMEFSNDGRALLLNNSLISGTRATGSIKINDGSRLSHFNGIELNGKTGGNHMIGYYDSASFLKFESRGNAYHPSGKEYDFVFEGAGARNGNINILVDGDVTVEKAVKSNKQNIEMRSVANEGWGFYAT